MTPRHAPSGARLASSLSWPRKRRSLHRAAALVSGGERTPDAQQLGSQAHKGLCSAKLVVTPLRNPKPVTHCCAAWMP